MPKRQNSFGYGMRSTVSSAPNPNKRRRGPYKKRPKLDEHEHTYAIGSKTSETCIVCGAPRNAPRPPSF